MDFQKRKTKPLLPVGLQHIQTREVVMEASDGMELAGTLYQPIQAPKASILLSGGTGIPRTYYTGVSAYLADHGYAVLTYDFRGVGGSRPTSLAGFEATKRDWARLDMSAAFQRLVADFPDIPHYVLGHSVGGQLLALMENPEAIDGVVTYGSGFGYWANIKGSYRYFVAAMWYVGIPLITSLFRYLPAKRLNLGEDLPTGVAADWARWGKRSDYFGDELGDEPGFAKVDCPWVALLAEDDNIATESNARPLYNMYPNANVQVRTLKPQDYDLAELGHMHFFSRRKKEAWTALLEAFAQIKQSSHQNKTIH